MTTVASAVMDKLSDRANLNAALELSLASAVTLAASHLLCVGIVMYFDLTGRWDGYKLHKTRNVSVKDYAKGLANFAKDLALLFVPFMTVCYAVRVQEIRGELGVVRTTLLLLLLLWLRGAP